MNAERNHVPISDQLKALPPCPRPCGTCNPGHHWYLDIPDQEEGDEDAVINAVCKHCDAILKDIDPSDPLCPEF